LHVWVIERIIGWKTRSIVTLESYEEETPKVVVEVKKEEPKGEDGGIEEESEEVEMTDIPLAKPPLLDVVQAAILSDKLVTEYISCRKKRMEISRVNPRKCPVVIASHASKEQRRATTTTTKPKFGSKTSDQTEQVLLIKWRGRSYLQCSWERIEDLERFDASNNTAKGKIKRYFQSQETLLGTDWKKTLEEGRKTSTAGSLPGLTTNQVEGATKQKEEEEEEDDLEEFFQPDYLEVERMYACDENEMDMNVLARQRALNLKAERDVMKRRQKGLLPDDMPPGTIDNGTTISTTADSTIQPLTTREEEEPWDPEDNVRYVVKWKGLQNSEITWEYWRHIKHDSVDQAEDFWHRQKAPDPEELKAITAKGHPHMREYKKMVKSPSFGISVVKRPVGDVGEMNGLNDMITNNDDADEDDNESTLRLRNYQLEGVNWILWNWWHKRSCILADEMGLGKTIQTMCFLHQLHTLSASQVRGPFLVVAPLSLVSQWQAEAETWAPDMNVLLYHGSMDARDYLVKQEFYYSDQFMTKTKAKNLRRQHATKFHILITTYEVAMKDVAVLSKIRWKVLIVDEAHRLKNSQSRLFSELASVPRDFCLLLTGTPLQNSTEELWSLLNFSDKVAFASKEQFVSKFGQLSDSKQVSELHQVLRPYLLRRVKEDVEKSLPPKVETILEVSLTPIQKTYYKAIYEKNTSFLFKGSKPSNAPSLMNIMMELRKCCNHPFLIKGAEERIMAEAAAKKGADDLDDPVLRWQKLLTEQLVQSSGKMVLLMKLLPKLQSGGHKVLIFSQMVRVLDLLEELLRLQKYSYERLDGSMGASSRASAVDRFCKKSYNRFVMLLSTRAGGLGLNLTSADTVVIFDSDWNPQNDLQAMARAHRIGQTRHVRVYRLLTAKTYEMHMFHTASMKLGLDRAVLAHQRQQDDTQDTSKKTKSKSEKEIQAKEIDELLKKGAYDVFRDDDDTEAQKFMETDIDQLLERSSRTVTYGNTDTSISSGLANFSKASFVTADADGKDIDLDDPDFWEKAVGLNAPVETSVEESLMFSEKRNRKQVQVFDPYASFHEAEEKKKDKIAKKIKQDKEERRRLKQEKRRLREKEKARRKKARKENGKYHESISTKSKDPDRELVVKEKKPSRENKSKRIKQSEQRRNLRSSIEPEDPVLDRIKQGWENNQRDRAINGILLFGFGRFCKIRNESNLTSLPIQDIEVFLRAYVYQLGLQASVSLLSNEDTENGGIEEKLSVFLGTLDGDWVANAILSSMKFYKLLHKERRDLRIPQILAQPTFVAQLRAGSALVSLQSLAFLTRLNRVVEHAMNESLADLGQEELGKRGCPTKDLSTLDVDLKARHVTTEELSHAIGRRLEGSWINRQLAASRPAPWWDRGCDLGLIIGTFTYGLHSYRAMQNDNDLPFQKKICGATNDDYSCSQAFRTFLCATKAARNTFDKALSVSQAKHAADEVMIVNSLADKNVDQPSGEEQSKEHPNGELVCDVVISKESSKGKVQMDDGVVTILCLSRNIRQAVNEKMRALPKENVMESVKNNATTHVKLPMPDSRCLDARVLKLINLIENTNQKKSLACHDSPGSKKPKRLRHYLGVPECEKNLPRAPFGENTSTMDRNILDGTSSYLLGAASENLAIIFTTHESQKYKRGIGVPSVLTRYGIIALLYSDTFTLKKFLDVEETRLKKERERDDQAVDYDGFANNGANAEDTEMFQAELHSSYMNCIPTTLTNDAVQRTGLCRALLCCGYSLPTETPCPTAPSQIFQDICNFHSFSFFSITNLLEVASGIIGSNVSFSEEGAILYIKNVLIPHCTHACLMSSDLFEETRVPSCINTNMKTDQENTHIPEPFLPISQHSGEAIRNASSLLRRMKMATTIRFLLGEGGVISPTDLLDFLKSPKMRNYTNGVPLWWCPWIHDLALLAYAAKYGLLSVVRHLEDGIAVESRGGEIRMDGGIFDVPEIEKHVKRLFYEHDNVDNLGHTFPEKRFLPKLLIEKASPLELQRLVDGLSRQFPSLFVIERRLGFICGELSRISGEKVDTGDGSQDGGTASWMFVDFPMFDHGGWPRDG